MVFSPRDSVALRDIVNIAKPLIIVEVGSWYGASIVALLREADGLGLPTKAICIDTWLGSVEHWLDTYANSEFSYSQLNVSYGEPRFIDDFKANIKQFGFENRVEIIRAPSEIGLSLLAHRQEEVDVIYIDADHSYRAVVRDVGLSFKLVRSGTSALVSGDDWGWRTVRHAVIISSFRYRSSIWVKENTWVLLRNGDWRAAELEVLGWHPFSHLDGLRDIARAYLSVLARGSLRNLIDPMYKRISRWINRDSVG